MNLDEFLPNIFMFFRYINIEQCFFVFFFRLRDYSDIWGDLRTNSQLYRKILVPSHCVYSEGASHAIYEHIFEDRRLPRQSPIIFLKSVKNPVEIRRMQEASIRDAAAVCDCYAYLEKCVCLYLYRYRIWNLTQ